MPVYKAPVEEVTFLLRDVFRLDRYNNLPGFAEATPDVIEAVLAESAKFSEAVLMPLNRCLAEFHKRGLPVFATRDWHPPDHCSFHARGGPWPPHCIAGTAGAQFAPGLQLPQDARIISKATGREADAYSGFQGTDLLAQLRQKGCARVFLGGLATDYCVRATALDALGAGLAVIVLTDAVRAVDAKPGDGERALAELTACGAVQSTTGALC